MIRDLRHFPAEAAARIALATALLGASAGVFAGPTDGVAGEKPTTMNPVEVTAARLDLNPDPEIDFVNPKLRMIFENLGHRVPGTDIMHARVITDLRENWRPTYNSLEEFVDSVSREGWIVAAKRDLADFYVVALLTKHGNVAGVYYAKDDLGIKAQRLGSVKLFVADKNMRQIVPDDSRLDLDQRWRYSATSSTNQGAQGLMPTGEADDRMPQVAMNDVYANKGYSTGTMQGWLVYHEGLYFVMPGNVKQFLLVFVSGYAPGDRMALSFGKEPPP
jgi:hypothetical protein